MIQKKRNDTKKEMIQKRNDTKKKITKIYI